MAVVLDENKSLFTLYTDSSMYQMKVDNLGVLLHTYYGKRTGAVDYSYLISSRDRGFAGNPYQAGTDRTYSLEVLPQEYSCFGSGDYRASALKIRYHMGARALELRYVGHEILEGKYAIPGLPAVYAEEGNRADTLVMILKDDVSGVFVSLYYGVLEDLDVITRAVRIENRGEQPIYLERALSMCLDQIYGSYDLLTFYGKHEMERKLSRAHIHHGVQSVGSVRGTSSHHYNPFMVLAERSATETQGNCYGFSFLYSGNFLGEAEYDQFNQTRVLMGIHPDNFEFALNPGEDFRTPEVAMVYSDSGFEKMSQTFHYAFRNNLCRGKYKKARRPVLMNNWEGTYFHFTGEKLVQMAKEAADLGVELFVMDDGWFGKRDSDDSGLGDWFVNEKKLGCTLAELSAQIHELGMKFGIWFEPEMISEDSDLYRAHPDWCLHIPGRGRSLSRNQMVLDMSRQDVLDYLFQSMSAILSSANIEYVKWDMNRNLTEVSSRLLPADRQQETWHRYILGVYQLMERLLEAFPNLLLEGCAGGGGRFDPGLLYYAPQYWTSDDTDALERVKIQYGTSYVYPVSSMGAHVSVCPNEQTKRSVELQTRGYVAMAGTFGYELDLTKITQEEKEMMRRQIQQFKELHGVITYGDQYRLVDPFQDADMAAWMFVSEDKTEALVQVVQMRTDPNPPLRRIRLQGLDPSKRYREQDSGRILSGQAWMNAGINIPEMYGDGAACIFHLLALEL